MVRADYTTAFPTRIQEYIHTLRCDSVGTLPCCSRAPPHTGGTLSGGSTALPRAAERHLSAEELKTQSASPDPETHRRKQSRGPQRLVLY
eukprot:594156-Prorocentrum_minimum.AAC.5